MKQRILMAVVAALALALSVVALAGPAHAGAPYSCTTGATHGVCGPYAYPPITGSKNGPDCPQAGGSCVSQDVWNPPAGYTGGTCQPGTTAPCQELQANSPGDWSVTANYPAGNTAILSYPDAVADYDQPLSAFSQITAAFAEDTPQGAGTLGEASFDDWFNNSSGVNEVMIQTDFVGRTPDCGGKPWAATGVAFGGSNGVPVHHWDLCAGTTTDWWETADGNLPSSSVDVLAMQQWLEDHGYLAPGSVMHDVAFGWEIQSTGGQPENWTVSNFSIDTGQGGSQPPSPQQAPAVTTGPASNITRTAATVAGTVNPEGAATTYRVDYGTTAAYGSATAAASARSGTGAVNEAVALTGLAAGTTYHYRVEATNSGGTSYGADQTFTTARSTKCHGHHCHGGPPVKYHVTTRAPHCRVPAAHS